MNNWLNIVWAVAKVPPKNAISDCCNTKILRYNYKSQLHISQASHDPSLVLALTLQLRVFILAVEMFKKTVKDRI